MRIIDISLPLGADTPVYPGDPPISVERVSEAHGGDSYALSRLTLGSHAGTHLDPPAHFIPGGATAESIDLAACIGPALVLDVAGSAGEIGVAEVAAMPQQTERVLLRTGGPALGGRALSADAARWLASAGVRLVGIDALSIAPASGPGTVHRILLAAGVVILEGLDLRDAPVGGTTLLCLPLRISGGDGAPARAVVIVDDAWVTAQR